jgi:hypothetical protein
MRTWTAAKILDGLGAESDAVRARIDPQGRFGALAPVAETGPLAATRAVGSSRAHPSWHAAAARALLPSAACAYLDRLEPTTARAAAAELARDGGGPGPAARPATRSPLLDALLGRSAPPVFPPQPAWAVSLESPAHVLLALGDAEWPVPATPAESEIVEAALASLVEGRPRGAGESAADRSAARGLARLAFALQRRADEAWGLAGAWPRTWGRALLAAWNAWPDRGASAAGAAATIDAAHRRVLDGWRTWAAS